MAAPEGPIEFNGVRYDSIEDVPEPHRSTVQRLLADADGDGRPDILGGADSTTATTTVTSTSYEVDGVRYASIDEIPEPQRNALRGLLADVAEPAGSPGSPRASPATSVSSVSTYEVDGVRYGSIDEVPEPMRSRMKGMLEGVDTTSSAAPSGERAGVAVPPTASVAARRGVVTPARRWTALSTALLVAGIAAVTILIVLAVR